ncbi:hypothetical protein I4U23_031029 [Adineta vaga]|nr:hypothetical protein I4U23_031029 [Adineta vaga]
MMSNSNEQYNHSPWSEHKSTIKPSWQIARDVSTAMLWRKSSKLSFKPEFITNSNKQRFSSKKHSIYSSETSSKSSQLHRTPRMPTEKEAALIDIAYKLSCAFCDESCIGNYLRCRVCIHSYHVECLSQRGYLYNPPTSFRRHVQQDWSCPDCCDLTRLLHHEELLYLIHAFDQIDKNRDGYIILDEFLSLQTNKSIPDGLELFVQHNQELGKRYFSLMDSAQTGVVAWSDFVLLYSCKLISAKDKIELMTKLTEKELVTARKLFLKDPRKSFDNDFNRIITREYFNKVHQDLILSLNKKYGINFIDAILSFDHHTDNTSIKPSVVYWPEFLREIALFILLDRSNNDVRSNETRRASIPAHLSNASKVFYPTYQSNEHDSTRRLTLSRSNTLVSPISTHVSYDESFLKHAKLLQKINQTKQKSYRILEEESDVKTMKLPKLKVNARDDRRTITDPWTSVKEMQRLRNEPILLRSTIQLS